VIKISMHLPELWWFDCIIQNDYADSHIIIKPFSDNAAIPPEKC
jgi:hypothetical protein